MDHNELIATITELQELKRMQEELAAEITAAQDKIKAVMGDDEFLSAGQYKVSWKSVTSSRIDTKALAAELPEIAKRYNVSTTFRRFSVQ